MGSYAPGELRCLTREYLQRMRARLISVSQPSLYARRYTSFELTLRHSLSNKMCRSSVYGPTS